MKVTRTMGTMLLAATVLLALTAATADAGVQKGKPPTNPTATPTPGGGGSTPPGIVYLDAGSDNIVKTDADGSNQTTLTGFTGNTRNLGTHSQHGGQAYFLNWEFDSPDPVYPDGQPIRDVYVYDESANRIALTSLDASMQAVGGYNWSYDAARAIQDGVVLFTAREFDTGGNVTAAGIYQVQVAFDTGGGVTGPVAGSLALVVPAPLILNGSRGLFPDVSYISANGAGTELVYDRISDSALMRTAFPTSSTNHTALGITGRAPEWSPTEDLIAFSFAYDLYTADTSGGNVQKIVSGRARQGKKNGYSNDNALFSYNGDHLLFRRWFDPGGSAPTEVYRVAKDGSGLTKIANALGATGWTAP